ncbi:hypothetical protein KM176_23050 [Pseudooceanicola sp. CBS1P-1]|uniref:Uncharacterized protein n=1 Tax=Pseudooceanicola albus TaxID=2692189 RepID=A0A6L7GDC1_9RHOB|nr:MULTISPECIES: hypothetical protein [Pseudooceanicola]MBT9386744.1 hypothetical protein [Pseudooceanicola endophyticus]MXN20773.1 hypothetical protein [Pseudooceanicola albus]
MSNPFSGRAMSLNGPARDLLPVTPSDSLDLTHVACGLYVEQGGVIVLLTEQQQTRTVTVADFSILPVGVRRVLATGTTATGIHALVQP